MSSFTWPSIPAPSTGFFISGTAVTTDSNALTATSYTAFSNSPTVTFEPTVSSNYIVTLGPIDIRCNTVAIDVHAALIATAGSPTWVSGGEAVFTQMVAAENNPIFLQGTWYCVAGTTYTFQLRGYSAADSINFYNSPLVNGSAITVQQVSNVGFAGSGGIGTLIQSSFCAQTGGGAVVFPGGSDVYVDLTTITLTPGTWLTACMFMGYQEGSPPVTLDGIFCGISTGTSGNTFSDRQDAINTFDVDITTGPGFVMTAQVPMYPLIITQSTTVILKGIMKQLNAGTPMIEGYRITALRIA